MLTRNAAGLHLYLDGKRVASDPRPVAAASLSEVGCSHGVAGMPGRFRVASVAVWDRALTDRDVERLYALQHGPDHFSKGDIVRLSNAVFFQ